MPGFGMVRHVVYHGAVKVENKGLHLVLWSIIV
jgi:hypothetical protein